jgi:hypothetical protein
MHTLHATLALLLLIFMLLYLQQHVFEQSACAAGAGACSCSRAGHPKLPSETSAAEEAEQAALLPLQSTVYHSSVQNIPPPDSLFLLGL